MIFISLITLLGVFPDGVFVGDTLDNAGKNHPILLTTEKSLYFYRQGLEGHQKALSLPSCVLGQTGQSWLFLSKYSSWDTHTPLLLGFVPAYGTISRMMTIHPWRVGWLSGGSTEAPLQRWVREGVASRV